MEPKTLRALSDDDLRRLKHAVKQARHHAERVWELALRIDHRSGLVLRAKQEAGLWHRAYLNVKRERTRRARRKP